jgi:hypothetical protein
LIEFFKGALLKEFQGRDVSALQKEIIIWSKDVNKNNKYLWSVFAHYCTIESIEAAVDFCRSELTKSGLWSTRIGPGKSISNIASAARRARSNEVSIFYPNGDLKSVAALEAECRLKEQMVHNGIHANVKNNDSFATFKQAKIVQEAIDIIRLYPDQFQKEIALLLSYYKSKKI